MKLKDLRKKLPIQLRGEWKNDVCSCFISLLGLRFAEHGNTILNYVSVRKLLQIENGIMLAGKQKPWYFYIVITVEDDVMSFSMYRSKDRRSKIYMRELTTALRINKLTYDKRDEYVLHEQLKKVNPQFNCESC